MFVAIFTMVIIAYIFRDKIAVETLVVPDRFQPSCPSRAKINWLINPFTSEEMEIWMYFAALIPAGLVSHPKYCPDYLNDVLNIVLII